MKWHAVAVASIFAAVVSTGLISAAQATSAVPGSPPIINPYFDWGMADSDMPALAKWDVVVLDADQSTNSPDKIRKLRELNPKIKILAYVASEEISDARFNEPTNYPNGWLASQMHAEYELHDAQGNRDYFWQGSRMVNVTDLGPAAPDGSRWNTFLPQYIHDHVLSTGMWDGIFLDNCFDAVSYYAKTPVDLNRDGVADTKDAQDSAWRAGMTKIINKIHEQNPNILLMGNGGAYYASKLNGAFFEGFPSYDWATNWKEFRNSVAQNVKPTLASINVNTKYDVNPTNYQLMRFGLASALVGGGYFSFDNMQHHTLWWYDEYDVPLGSSRAAAHQIAGTLWSRDFQHGIAVVNATNAMQHVPLPGVFEKIRGTQDRSMNDGSLVTSIDLASKDGAILIRQSEPQEIIGSAYPNGSFMRMVDASGQQIQNGFFAQRTDAPSGATVLTAPLHPSLSNELVIAEKGVVRVVSSAASTSFFPFGKTYAGDISIAAGNTNRSPESELVVGRGTGASPEVAVMTPDGKTLVRWNAYQPKFSGGVRVAIGDLNGDGLNEIVTGAGPGGGPHIRIWKTDGTTWGGSFFAFDESERGGVQIAVGDVDGDGKDEIVAASGQGSIPRVRIFDGHGTLKKEISFGTKPIAAGLQVAVSDMNGDGKKEILVSGIPLF